MNKKALKTTVASLALVGVIGVGATLAYMSDMSNDLTNTFTVGDGYPDIPGGYEKALLLHEKSLENVDDCNAENNCYLLGDEQRTLVGNGYIEINTGDILKKDPKLTLAANSPDSYIYIRVKGLDELKGKLDVELNDNWSKIVSSDSSLDGIYRYKGTKTVGNVDGIVHVEDTAFTTQALFETMKAGQDIENYRDNLNDVRLWGVAVQATYKDNGVETAVSHDEADRIANGQIGSLE